MKRTGLGLVAALAVCACAGCTVTRLMSQGDAHLLANRPAEAVRCYEAALAKDPDLAQSGRFTGKLGRARSRAAHERGRRAAEQKQWDEAIAAFSESLEHESFFERAKGALRHAKAEAAKVHHKRAMELADQGKLNDAILELEKAHELDPGNPDVRDALDSVKRKKGEKVSQARGLYGEALALAADRRWGRAAEALETALAADPNHVLCRVARCRSQTTMAEAKHICSEGADLLARKRLDRARRKLVQGLEVWPFYPQGLDLLRETDSRIAQADGLYRKAAALGSRGEWDAAVASVAASIKVYPFRTEAQVLLRRARNEAAAAHCRAGAAWMTRGDLGKAEDAFIRALGYVPNMTAAREGLAKADFTRGESAAQKGHWGNALLWYLQAADHLPGARYAAKIRDARARVRERVRFGMTVEVRDKAAAPPAATAALKSGVLAQLSRAKPDVLDLVAAGGDAAGPVAYRARIELTRLDVAGGLSRTENRIYRYTVYRMVPNPEIPRLQSLLLAAERRLAYLRREYRRPCHVCRGTGRVACPACRGRGVRSCTFCRGTGWQGGNQANGPCKVCQGRGKRPCSVCRGRGQGTCGHCRGTGRSSTVSRWDIERQERDVSSLSDQLRSAPAMVRQAFPAEWPYVVKHYQKVGSAETAIQVTSVIKNAVVRADTVRRQARYSDSTIENANPGIGLGADGLALPSDASIRQLVLGRATSDTASKLLAAVVSARVTALKATADGLSRGGDRVRAMEAAVDYARVLEAASPSAAARLLNSLKKGLQTHPDPSRVAPEMVPK